jgi:hypothetical protein
MGGSAGRYTNLVVDAQGRLHTWGLDGCGSPGGQLPPRADLWRPRVVGGELEGKRVVAFDSGGWALPAQSLLPRAAPPAPPAPGGPGLAGAAALRAALWRPRGGRVGGGPCPRLAQAAAARPCGMRAAWEPPRWCVLCGRGGMPEEAEGG